MFHVRSKVVSFLLLVGAVAGCGVPEDASEAPSADPQVVRGALATSGPYYTRLVRDEVVPFRETHIRSLKVDSGRTVTITAVGDGATDPYIIAYYNDGFYHQVGVNDDVSPGDRSSKVVWKNELGTYKFVEYIVFAYSDSTAGTGRVKVTLDSTTYSDTRGAVIGGAARYWDALSPPAAPCANVVETTFDSAVPPDQRRAIHLIAKGPGDEWNVYFWRMLTAESQKLRSLRVSGDWPTGTVDLIFSPDTVPAGKTIRITKQYGYQCP